MSCLDDLLQEYSIIVPESPKPIDWQVGGLYPAYTGNPGTGC